MIAACMLGPIDHTCKIGHARVAVRFDRLADLGAYRTRRLLVHQHTAGSRQPAPRSVGHQHGAASERSAKGAA
jgi:hypothetical protein